MQEYFDYQYLPHVLYTFSNINFINLRRKNTITFAANRELWAKETCYVYPGPIQYFGPTEVCDQTTKTLALEQQK